MAYENLSEILAPDEVRFLRKVVDGLPAKYANGLAKVQSIRELMDWQFSLPPYASDSVRQVLKGLSPDTVVRYTREGLAPKQTVSEPIQGDALEALGLGVPTKQKTPRKPRTGPNRVSGAAARSNAERTRAAITSQGGTPNDIWAAGGFADGPSPLPMLGGLAPEIVGKYKTELLQLATAGTPKEITRIFNKLPAEVQEAIRPLYNKSMEIAAGITDKAVAGANAAVDKQLMDELAGEGNTTPTPSTSLEPEIAKKFGINKKQAAGRAAAVDAATEGAIGKTFGVAESLVTARPQVVSALEAHLKEFGKLPTDSKEFRALLVKMGAPAEAVEKAAWPSGLKAVFGPEKAILGQMKELNQLWTKAAPDEAVRKSVAGAAAKELNQIFNPLVDGFQKGTTQDTAAMRSLLKSTKGMLGKQFVGEAGDILGVFSKHPVLSSIGVGLVGIAADQLVKTGLSAMQPVPEETMLRTMPTPEQAVADDLANELHQEQMMRTVANYYPEQASSIIDSLMGGGRVAAPQGPAVDPNSPALPTELSSYGR